MVPPENMVSVGAQHAIWDMVELEMYLLSQSQQTAWSMLPRSVKKSHETKKTYSNLVEFSVAKELVDLGFIENTSNRTFVVSKAGYQFYERMKSLVSVDPSRPGTNRHKSIRFN
jgi:hypothetical protein